MINSEELNKLTYTTAFIKESMRMFNTIPTNFRVSAEDVVIDGHHFPKKTTFFLPVHVVNEDDCTFDAAEDFQPERYIENSKY